MAGPITLDEAGLARTAVLEGLGLGFFMEPDVRRDLEAGRLVSVLDGFALRRPALCLYYPGRKNPSAAFKAFIALARELGGRKLGPGDLDAPAPRPLSGPPASPAA